MYSDTNIYFGVGMNSPAWKKSSYELSSDNKTLMINEICLEKIDADRSKESIIGKWYRGDLDSNCVLLEISEDTLIETIYRDGILNHNPIQIETYEILLTDESFIIFYKTWVGGELTDRSVDYYIINEQIVFCEFILDTIYKRYIEN